MDTSPINFQEADVTFVIPTFLRDKVHRDNLIRTLTLLRLHHPDVPIKLINNASKLPLDLPDEEVIESDWPTSGEIVPYKYFHDEGWSEYMVMWHDNMHLQKPITEFWSPFTALFRGDKDSSYAAQLENLLLEWEVSEEVRAALIKIHNKGAGPWSLIQGSASIISHAFIKEIQEKVNLFYFLKRSNDRTVRMVMERMFGVFLSYMELEEPPALIKGLYGTGREFIEKKSGGR